jgi:hypothetical protein
MFSSRRHERIEGFQAKLGNASEDVIGKCKKCEVKPPSKEVSYARKKGRSPIKNELLGDNFNSTKKMLGNDENKLSKLWITLIRRFLYAIQNV